MASVPARDVPGEVGDAMTPTHYLHTYGCVNSLRDPDKPPSCEGGGQRNLRNRGPWREVTQPRPHSSQEAELVLGLSV